MVHREHRLAGVIELLRRSFDFRRIKALVWPLPVLLLMPVVNVLVNGLMLWTGRPVPAPQLAMGTLLWMLLAFFVGALGEELGWSGYILDDLQEHRSALKASLILGVVELPVRRPTLIMIPCFAGAPWRLDQLSALQDWPLRTPRLLDDLDDVECLADFVLAEIRELDGFVLVGDSFGAVIALAIAIRRTAGLKALVISGGFARNPITSPLLRMLASLAPYFPGPLYRGLTSRMHAFNLRSRFDVEGEVPWSAARTREFFVRETPHRAYVKRIRAVRQVDYSHALGRIDVPALILTPEEDRLIGKEAAQILSNGIAGSEETVLPRTGHMFRFSHPGAYSTAVSGFLLRCLKSKQATITQQIHSPPT